MEIDNGSTEEFSMQHFTMKKNGFIRYSSLAMLWVSISMSSSVLADCIEFSETVFGECIEYSQYDEEDGFVNAEFMPTIYSGAAITMGAESTVFGDIQSVAAVTLGDSAEVSGSVLAGAAVTIERAGIVSSDVTAGEAVTLGASAQVRGDLAAKGMVFIGAESEISGNLTSGDKAKLGAGAKVGGNVNAVNSVTLGADTKVGNNGSRGSVRAVNGPIVLGRYAFVEGDASAGSIISFGHNAKVEGSEMPNAYPEGITNEANKPVATNKDELTQKQKELTDILLLVPSYIQLITTIDTSTEFYPGVYNASALTTTAGITLKFVGSGFGEPDEWLINVDTYISFGANLTIDLVDVAQGSTIIFNAGTYTTIGANSNVRGTFFAGTYITTGENTTISGIGSDCGGMFATNGAITLGAQSTVGSLNCWQEGQRSEEYFEDDEDYYEDDEDYYEDDEEEDDQDYYEDYYEDYEDDENYEGEGV
ncbi:MAG: MSHA biogenesis protein MshQ [Kangiellaceae bacterium]